MNLLHDVDPVALRPLWIRYRVRSLIQSRGPRENSQVTLTLNRWFQNVVLANRACGGGIAAWKGTNLTDAPGNRYGVYLADSRIIRVGSSSRYWVTIIRELSHPCVVTGCQCYNSNQRKMLLRYRYHRGPSSDSAHSCFQAARGMISRQQYIYERSWMIASSPLGGSLSVVIGMLNL